MRRKTPESPREALAADLRADADIFKWPFHYDHSLHLADLILMRETMLRYDIEKKKGAGE